MSKSSEADEPCICGHGAWVHSFYTGQCEGPDKVNPPLRCHCNKFISDRKAEQAFKEAFINKWSNRKRAT